MDRQRKQFNLLNTEPVSIHSPVCDQALDGFTIKHPHGNFFCYALVIEKLPESIVIIDIKLAACRKHSHFGMMLSLMQKRAYTVEELGIAT